MFEWDENKNKANLKKHGISFDEAKEIFNDINAIEFYDGKHSDNEDRYICLGDIGGLIILYVVYTDRNGKSRIISARKAEPREEAIYYEHIKRTLGRN